jgi:hypothetical protein
MRTVLTPKVIYHWLDNGMYTGVKVPNGVGFVLRHGRSDIHSHIAVPWHGHIVSPFITTHHFLKSKGTVIRGIDSSIPNLSLELGQTRCGRLVGTVTIGMRNEALIVIIIIIIW